MMLRQIVDALAAQPRVFDALRWTLEAGYGGHCRVIQRWLGNSVGPALDVGCGTGVFAGQFAADDYHGIDISTAYIEAARRKFPRHRFAVMDARRLDLTAAAFARGFVSGLLHHLPDDDVTAVLRELARVVSPGGRVVIWEDVPARSGWNVVGRGVHALDVGDCIRTPEEYRRLIEPWLVIDAEEPMRSGCMDYAVFACHVR